MTVMEGKQVTLRPYLTEKQCVKPITGQDAKTKIPMDCIPQEVRMMKAEKGSIREHYVQDAKPELIQAENLETKDVKVQPLSTVSVPVRSTVLDRNWVLDEAAGEKLTIEELFWQTQ